MPPYMFDSALKEKLHLAISRPPAGTSRASFTDNEINFLNIFLANGPAQGSQEKLLGMAYSVANAYDKASSPPHKISLNFKVKAFASAFFLTSGTLFGFTARLAQEAERMMHFGIQAGGALLTLAVGSLALALTFRKSFTVLPESKPQKRLEDALSKLKNALSVHVRLMEKNESN